MASVEPGHLYIVATPIGNLEDITFRAVETLRGVDLVAAEDTRRSRALLEHLGIDKPLLSYHEHNEEVRAEEILEKLLGQQSIALVSDAGTPLVSDPGYVVVREARRRGIPVTPIPGACAAVTALMAAGLPSDQWVFYGFVPRKPRDRKEWWGKLSLEPRTVIMYESPNRVVRTVEEMQGQFPARSIVVARELTKLHEEFISGSVEEVYAELSQRDEIRGEIVLVLSGAESGEIKPEALSDDDVSRMLMELVDKGLSKKDAVKQLTQITGLPKRRIYQLALELSVERSQD